MLFKFVLMIRSSTTWRESCVSVGVLSQKSITRLLTWPERASTCCAMLYVGDDNGRHAEAIKNVVRASYRVIMELEPLRSTAERTIYGLSVKLGGIACCSG